MPPAAKSMVTALLLLVPLLGLLLAGAALAAEGTAAPGDLRFERKVEDAEGQAFPPAIFPHWVHRINYRCDACHDSLYEMKTGSAEITMDMISAGESCGSCHNGEQAFASGVASCGRCHVQEGE